MRQKCENCEETFASNGLSICEVCRLKARHEKELREAKDRRTVNLWRHPSPGTLAKYPDMDYGRYESMLDEQDEKCLTCCKEFSANNPPQIDHCHSDGHVRGLLCRGCNTTLGHVKDDIETLRRMPKYLEANGDIGAYFLGFREEEFDHEQAEMNALKIGELERKIAALGLERDKLREKLQSAEDVPRAAPEDAPRPAPRPGDNAVLLAAFAALATFILFCVSVAKY